MKRSKVELKDLWQVQLDPENKGLKRKWQERPLEDAHGVLVPHTFNVGEAADEYRGAAWYQYTFAAPKEWADARVRLQFNGVYRDADFWMNGESIGSHYGSGYSTFVIDTKNTIQAGEENTLTVRVDNRYSVEALPWMHYFDWADDGGIFRPVYFLVTDPTAIEQVLIDAVPVIEKTGSRVEAAPIKVTYRTLLCEEEENLSVAYEILDGNRVLAAGEGALNDTFEIPMAMLWHFDAPKLHTARFSLKKDGSVTDTIEYTIGFRSLTAEGRQFIFNGEPVQLSGTEWMPGSDPRIGNAERKEDLERFLTTLKGCNCIYTRVHWQQDDAFYDWCDRHGMLVQEEIPTWGYPKEPVTATLEIEKAQLKDMLYSHYNHPSITTWGVGNELDGTSPITKDYVAKAVGACKAIDPVRLVSYVSNTGWFDGDDAANRADIMMLNEYMGTWITTKDVLQENAPLREQLPEATIEEIITYFREKNPDKPMVISEYGLCEPAFSGGDTRRNEIFLYKQDLYRKLGIDATIYFCLNDYRTQMGEDGEGRLKQRIHGSTDFYGVPKGQSYESVKIGCAPIVCESVEKDENGYTLELKVRDALPSYSVEGYYVMASATGSAPTMAVIPDLKPGESTKLRLAVPQGADPVIRIYRPTGDEILTL